jgi:hypothetical protein
LARILNQSPSPSAFHSYRQSVSNNQLRARRDSRDQRPNLDREPARRKRPRAAAKRASIAGEKVDQHNTGSPVYERIERVIVERAPQSSLRRSGYYGCMSACPLIRFAGRHAIIQRNSLLVFHMASNAITHQADPVMIASIAGYLKDVAGMTTKQATFPATAAAPDDGWIATESAAAALGFRFQYIPSLFANRTCQAKFCVSVP